MADKNLNENTTNELLVYIYKNRKILIFTGIIAGITSIIISLLLPVLYESSAIVFPTATSTVSFDSQSNAKASSMDFGDKENAEQLIQILESSPMRNRIITIFDLANVYEIAPQTKGFNYKLGKAYNEHISFERTKFGSIRIRVLDRAPERAAEITNKIVDLIDTLSSAIIKERTIPAFEINKRKLEHLRQEQADLNAQIDELSRMGVVDLRSRSGLIEALFSTKEPAMREHIKEQIKINEEYGSKYDELFNLREYRLKKMTVQEESYEQAEANANEEFPHKFVVEKASVSDKKAKPKRMIIVLVYTVASVLLVFISLLIKDRVKSIKESL